MAGDTAYRLRFCREAKVEEITGPPEQPATYRITRNEQGSALETLPLFSGECAHQESNLEPAD